ncbi:hypothetical protein FN846DRAFT_1006746 [Sphaerosporella brunnea]|uniref:Uncharacterized protein n=1 Tax=Sphaerosporella brunnea TaxID=1250544 RepID=A0A5J5FA51_9PEZI|nr:hypothetical protein FN846DRAFT_1006746 [Sphaerosporella brunnea]
MDDGESRRFTERIFGTTLCHLFTTPDRVLLLDEAQTSYYELGFWNDFLKQLGETGVHVILFGCYGSPRRSPFSMAAETAGTPLILKEPQRIGRSWGGRNLRPLPRPSVDASPPLAIAPDLVRWLHGMTGGHVGALVSMLKDADGLRRIRLNRELMAVDLLLPHPAVAPDDALHNEAIAYFFRAMLWKGSLASTHLGDDQNMREIVFKSAWVQTVLGGKDSIIYLFPSPLHRWFYSYKLIPSSPEVDFNLYPRPLNLILAIQERFKPSELTIVAQCSSMAFYGDMLPGYGFGVELLVDGQTLRPISLRCPVLYHHLVNSGVIKKN